MGDEGRFKGRRNRIYIMCKKRRGNGTIRVKWVKVWEHGVQEQTWGGIANTRLNHFIRWL